jgi:lipopolysaccharide export LptBFGC system permease protein LptF
MSGFGFGLLVVGGYYLLLIGADTIAAEAWLPPMPSAWLPNAVLAVVSILLVWRLDRAPSRRR